MIVFNAYVLFFMFSLGTNIAGGACVGRSIGKGNATEAKSYAKLIVLYTYLVNLVIAIGVVIFRE